MKFDILYKKIIFEENLKMNTEYIIKNGDTLSKIAKDNNMAISDICALNNISDPNKIKIGQKLILNKKEYIVISGDNFTKIAKKFHISLKDLIKANPNIDSNKLQIGTKLIIPSKIDNSNKNGKVLPKTENLEAIKIVIPFLKQVQGTKIKDGKHIPYLDTQNHLTIGYGCADKEYINQHKDGISQLEAQTKLKEQVTDVLDSMQDRFGNSWNFLNRNQRAALISYIYNLGINAETPNLVKLVQANNLKDAYKEITSVNPELENRRKQQQQLYQKTV